jgi:hypothetical protein
VEHPCYKCGANVEDGTAFCPHCNAPQIRVGGESAAQPADIPYPYPLSATAPAGSIQWPQALASSALAGFLAAVLMLIPLGAFGLGILAAGILSVLFYHRKTPVANITPGVGARLGALSGMLGFSMFAILTAVESLVFRSGGELRAALLAAIEKSAARSSDPQAQQMINYLKSPPGLALVMAVGLLVMLFAFLIFSTLGGVIGAILLRRKDRL